MRLNFFGDYLDIVLSYYCFGEVQLLNGDFSGVLEFLYIVLSIRDEELGIYLEMVVILELLGSVYNKLE